jgi:hypothetical protein
MAGFAPIFPWIDFATSIQAPIFRFTSASENPPFGAFKVTPLFGFADAFPFFSFPKTEAAALSPPIITLTAFDPAPAAVSISFKRPISGANAASTGDDLGTGPSRLFILL